MRTKNEFKTVLLLKNDGLNDCEIARITSIPRRTIQGWIKTPPKIFTDNIINNRYYYNNELKEQIINDINLKKIYSYILGLYLGDGCIDILSRTLRLRIFLDAKYVHLNNYVEEMLKIFFYKSKITRYNHGDNCICFAVNCKELKNIFPQMGPGRKHNREIKLSQWQTQNIMHSELLMGLFHSDGCFYVSDDRDNYNFSNRSVDIHNIFQNSCTYFNVKYTVSRYQGEIKSTNINKRKDVVKLYYLIGSKDNIVDFRNRNDNDIILELKKIDGDFIKVKPEPIHKPIKMKIKKEYFCPLCNKKIKRRNKTCEDCAKTNQRKVVRPPYEQLLKEVTETSYVAVGKKYSVSDNAIRKWIKFYEKTI